MQWKAGGIFETRRNLVAPKKLPDPFLHENLICHINQRKRHDPEEKRVFYCAFRLQCDRVNQPEKCAAQMRGMTDIVVLLWIEHHVNRIPEIEQAKNVARNRNRDEEKVDSQIRNYRDGCEQNP